MKQPIKVTETIFPMPVLLVATYNEDGSIKKIGLYQKVHDLLKGYQIVELPGIQPNLKL